MRFSLLICSIALVMTSWSANHTDIVAPKSKILIDRYLSAEVGDSLYTSTWGYTQHYITRANALDKYLITRATLFAIEQLAINYLTVMKGQYFGVGARLREFGYDGISYHLQGETSYTAQNRVTHENSSLANQRTIINSARLMADELSVDNLAMEVVSSKYITYQNASMMFANSLDHLLYIFRNENHAKPGGLQEYVARVNQAYGEQLTSIPAIKAGALLNFLDPLLYLSAIEFIHYLGTGKHQLKYDKVYFGEIGYMTRLKMLLTPFGQAIQWSNYISFDHIAVSISYANGVSIYKYRQMALTIRPIKLFNSFAIGTNIIAWHQPDLTRDKLDGSPNEFGYAASLQMAYKQSKQTSILVDIGYKTKGYCHQEFLKPGVRIRAGIYVSA